MRIALDLGAFYVFYRQNWSRNQNPGFRAYKPHFLILAEKYILPDILWGCSYSELTFSTSCTIHFVIEILGVCHNNMVEIQWGWKRIVQIGLGLHKHWLLDCLVLFWYNILKICLEWDHVSNWQKEMCFKQKFRFYFFAESCILDFQVMWY